ncbi:peptidoglycan-binding domain-containing protein [Actibacterium ureilyticum]|uniref:peptidoglycan-binding domain-containing protein n=1 Tax=Actibacterium ureilyticum TaxID=1590614 RepID=UPI000BAB23E7|nr:peptidoglycan-binding domain-containing protein [Actibacterium ureilyticum]
MFHKHMLTAAVAASLTLVPATRVSADAGDALVGGIIGGVIGGAIANNAKKKPQKKVYYKSAPKKSSGISAATRAQNREVQTSLNYFGFPAGSPDGVLGRNSRSAISQYQVFMGYPASGYLTVYERDFLVNSYHRAIAGGPATTQLVATNPMGTKGLLKTYQQNAAGGIVTAAPGMAQPMPGQGMVAVAPAPGLQQPQPAQPGVLAAAPVPGVMAVAPVTGGVPNLQAAPAAPAATMAAAPVAPAPTAPVLSAPQPAPVVEAVATPALPSFMGETESVSLASHCNEINLLTTGNGGFATEANLTNPEFALNEQFCLARTYSMTKGEEMASKVKGFSAEQIAQQCAGLGAAVKSHVTALSQKPMAQVVSDVKGFVGGSGMSAGQLSGTSKICLSVGYRTDDMDLAIGSALLLVAVDEPIYAELLGHHLTQGFGAAKRPDLGTAWYEAALTALDNGAAPAFAPGQPERKSLIRKAALMAGGTEMATGAADETAPQPAALPVFTVTE